MRRFVVSAVATGLLIFGASHSNAQIIDGLRDAGYGSAVSGTAARLCQVPSPPVRTLESGRLLQLVRVF